MYLNTYMNNFYNLNFDFDILDPTFEFPKPQTWVWDIYMLEAKGFINQTVIDYFDNIGLNLHNCHLFRGAPGAACSIHVDGHESNDDSKPIWAINWILGSRSSEMIWYEPISQGNETLTHAGSLYQKWDLNQVKELERTKIISPTLVRTDIPHRVLNYDTVNPRWCISIRTNKLFKDWTDTVNFFKPWIKN